MSNSDCEIIQEKMSQRLYEALEQEEESQVHSHLDTCAQCSGEWEKMQAWVKAMPTETPNTQFDLWPSVRSSITETEIPMFPWKRLVVSGAIGFAIGLVGLGYLTRSETSNTPAQVAEKTNIPFVKVESLRQEFKFKEARALLADWLESHPGASDAGKIQVELARISFDDQENYQQAYEDYEQLRTIYPNEFTQDAEQVYRLNLLDEARGQDGGYTVLHRLSRVKVTRSISSLEQLIIDFPGSFMADEAVAAMVESASLDKDQSEIRAAMASLLEQCTHPVALTYVQLGVANHYSGHSGHSEMVVELYETVAGSDVPELAQLARQRLARHIP